MELLLVALISLITFIAVACLITGGEMLAVDYFRRWSGVTRATSQQVLNELFVTRITPRDVVVLTIMAIFGVGLLVWLVTGNPLLTLVAGVVTFFMPGPVFVYLRERRRRLFEEYLPVGLDQLVSYTRAGLNLIQALEEASINAPLPVNQEFGLIVRDYRVGWDLGSAIDAARHRVNSRTFNLVATALMINHEKGGNLPETLTTISTSLKEIWRLEQKLFTSSAEARRGIRVISLVPVGVFLLVYGTQPDVVRILVGTWAGWVLMTVAAVVYGLGVFWAMRVLDIDI